MVTASSEVSTYCRAGNTSREILESDRFDYWKLLNFTYFLLLRLSEINLKKFRNVIEKLQFKEKKSTLNSSLEILISSLYKRNLLHQNKK